MEEPNEFQQKFNFLLRIHCKILGEDVCNDYNS